MDARRGRDRAGSLAARGHRLWVSLAPLRDRVRSRFEVDARALAALRIALGLILLVDLVHRAGDLALFYTDAGVYPTGVYEVTYPRYTGLSIHAGSGALWFQQLLFVLAGLFALALVVGYRTRLVAVVSLVLLYSLHARNPLVLNGGDRLLRVLLLVAIPTPLGERWSVDALRRGSARASVIGFPTAALLVQPVAVFESNAILKHGGNTWYAGEALRIAFANDVMTVFLGNHLAAYPALLAVLNWTWVALLAGSVLFLLATVGRLRALFALAYVGAFAGMLATMMVGLFPLVLTASVLPFLTAPFWDTAARLLPSGLANRLLPTGLATRLWALSRVGPVSPRPVEHRLLDALRERGHGGVADFTVDYAQSLLAVVGALFLVWIVVYSGGHATSMDVPDAMYDSRADEQRWGLYTPDPSSVYAWFVVEAQLEDDRSVDALDGGTVDFDRPPNAEREYETFRHRKYMETVRSSGRGDTSDAIAARYAAWACERADETHDGGVERVVVHQVVQPSPVDGEYEDPSAVTVVERNCASSESPDRVI